MIFAFVAAYFLGAIPTGYWLGKVVKGIDIRAYGSGNVGATNVFRTLGKFWGSTTLVIDIAKGFVASYVVAPLCYTEQGNFSFVLFQIAVGLAAIAGHVWTVWLRFKGGKGVATSCGVFLGIYPQAVAASLGVWAVVAFLSRYVSLASLLASFSFMLWMFVFYRGSAEFGIGVTVAFVLLCFIFFTHRSNIKRLAAGTENRIGGRKK